MPRTKTDKTVARPGYVMARLTEQERAKLNAMCERRSDAIGVKVTINDMIRFLIREAK